MKVPTNREIDESKVRLTKRVTRPTPRYVDTANGKISKTLNKKPPAKAELPKPRLDMPTVVERQVAGKGRICTKLEFRSNKMKEKKIHFEIDCSEMAELMRIDVADLVSRYVQ